MFWITVMALALGCGPQPAQKAEPAPLAPPAIAREQLVFAGEDAEGPVLAALAFQRELTSAGAVFEVEGFVARGGALRSPVHERVELAAWPGDGVPDALGAWRQQSPEDSRRVGWEDLGDALVVGLRSPSGSLELTLGGLRPAGSGVDPHGPLKWRSGVGMLVLDGEQIRGVGALEKLRGHTASPSVGDFAMWVLAPEGGGLVLGRQSAGQPGAALRVDKQGQGRADAFAAEVKERVSHAGRELPSRWLVDGQELARVGEAKPVSLPNGGVQDTAVARGAGAAIVFHRVD